MPDEIKIINIRDKNYPRLLKEIALPPEKLYVRGNLELKETDLTLAVVGTRRCSSYGKETTREIVADLVRAGFTIISGMARGIDTEAHKACLEAGGKTIAVLGSGVDEKSIYPQENIGLARKIVESGGAVISEFEPGTPGLPAYFPQRNRIVAGLSKGILVVEAPERSGALITARLGLDFNREIFAIPGPINWINSFGPNKLIKQGAKLVMSTDDILEEFGLPTSEKFQTRILPETDDEKKIYELLLREPLHIDKIIEKTEMSVSSVSSALSVMEIRGMIKNVGGNVYSL